MSSAATPRPSRYYQAVMNKAMETFFPLVTVKRKSTDLPWMNARLRSLIKKRKGIYRREGSSDKWRKIKEHIEDIVKERRQRYLDSQKQGLLVEDARRNFFRNIKANQTKERPKPFDVRLLFPRKMDKEVADELASFFNRISAKFDPLEP